MRIIGRDGRRARLLRVSLPSALLQNLLFVLTEALRGHAGVVAVVCLGLVAGTFA